MVIFCAMSWISFSVKVIKYGDFMCYDLGSVLKSVSVMVLCAMSWILFSSVEERRYVLLA